MSPVGAGGHEVAAAGGLVIRPGASGSGLEAVVVHRPRYDDWSLPKGKLDRGESFEQAAVREVEEETGIRCRLGAELAPSTYRDGRGRSKIVRYWLMEPLDDGGHPFEPNEEVDELRWLAPPAAAELVDYPHDRELLLALAAESA